MKPKVLYTATSDIHLQTFHLPYLKLLKELGYEVHLAYEKRRNIKFESADECHELSFKRNPFSKKNITAYKHLSRIINKNKYQLIHCHTPAVSVLTRLASVGTRLKNNTRVIYTAHGYHFYKGAGLGRWMLYFPIEILLSYVTDIIILINEEDYQLTKKYFFNNWTFKLKGIGVNSSNFFQRPNCEKMRLRKEYGYSSDEFILLYIAEIRYLKNQEFLIRLMPELLSKIENIKLVFAGTGASFDEMKALASELKVDAQIDFLGWRDDIEKLTNIADVGISSSRQEGLGLSLVEQMLCGNPIVASQNRGHRETIESGVNGFLFTQGDREAFIEYIVKLYNNPELYKKMAQNACEKAQEFLIENPLREMDNIYRTVGLSDQTVKPRKTLNNPSHR